MSSLLQNAVVSIQLGLEDFSSEDERRIISAVRIRRIVALQRVPFASRF